MSGRCDHGMPKPRALAFQVERAVCLDRPATTTTAARRGQGREKPAITTSLYKANLPPCVRACGHHHHQKKIRRLTTRKHFRHGSHRRHCARANASHLRPDVAPKILTTLHASIHCRLRACLPHSPRRKPFRMFTVPEPAMTTVAPWSGGGKSRQNACARSASTRVLTGLNPVKTRVPAVPAHAF